MQAVTRETGYARNASESAYPNLWRGLVGWWCPSINPRGGNRLFDLSPFQNHGTLTNMANDDWVVSGGQGALDFDGVNDFVNLGYKPIFDLAVTKTVAIWVFARAFDGSFSTNDIISTDNILGVRTWQFNATNPNGISTDARINVFSFGTAGGIRDIASTSEVLTVNRWHHIAFTSPDRLATASEVKVYVDGIQVNTTDLSSGTFGEANTLTFDNRLQLGWRPGNNNIDIAWNGLQDDCRLYSRVLSPSELRLLASKRGIGVQTRPKRYTYTQEPSGARRRRILTGMV